MRVWMLFEFLVCGCAAHFSLPMTAAEMVQYNSGPALVAYLAQPDASPTACDLRALSPHVPAITVEIRRTLVDGLVDGKIDPALWRRCINVVLKGLPRDQVPPVFDALGIAYRKMLADSAIERNPALVERLATIHRLYLERPAGFDGDAKVREPLFAELRAALVQGRLGPVATYFAQDLVATIDIEQGQWRGRAVDAAMLDTLAASGNEMILTRLAARLPSAELQEQARRRLVRVHIALSPFQEVRANAATVEETVIREGHNRVALSEHPLVSASFDASKTLIRGVLVREHLWAQTATLLGYAEGRHHDTVALLQQVILSAGGRGGAGGSTAATDGRGGGALNEAQEANAYWLELDRYESPATRLLARRHHA
jgi:hypothetical protein